MKAIVARFDGPCGICENRIRADVDEIVEVDGEWCHAECARDEGVEVE